MKLRELPGTLVLGLLASVAAHAAVSGDHAMGGAYHGLLVAAALLSAMSLITVAAVLTWIHSGRLADGSILAKSLSRLLPGFVPLVVATTASFWAIESIEPLHRWAYGPLVALAVIVAAWFLRSLTSALIRVLANLAIAIRRTSFAPRIPMWTRMHALPIAIRTSPVLRRRFARPPPRPVAFRA